MKRAIKNLLLGALAAMVLVFAVPNATGAADAAFVRHRPNHYRYEPYRRDYRSRYRYPRRSYYFGPRPRGYRYPRGYYDYNRNFYGPRGGIDIGPLRLRW